MAGKISNIIARILFVTGLFAQGLWLGSICAGKPDAEVPDPVSKSESSDIIQFADPIQDLQHSHNIAQQLLSMDDPDAALPHLLKLAAKKPNDANLLFRIALCREAASDFRRAAKLYQSAIQQTSNQSLRSVCQLGLARCRFQSGEVEDARSILWHMCYLTTNPDDGEIYGDALMWLAQSYNIYSDYKLLDTLESDVLIPVGHPSLDVSRQLRVFQTAERLKRPSNVVNKEEPAAPTKKQIPDMAQDILVNDIVRLDDSALGLIASFKSDQANLLELYRWNSAVLGIPFEITDAAIEIASQRSISQSLLATQLGTALDIQTLPFGLSWFIDDGSVTICRADELPSDLKMDLVRLTAQRLLDQFQLTYPNHPFLGFCEFQRAVLLALGGQGIKAIEVFDGLTKIHVNEKLRQSVNFNVGQMQNLMNRQDLASQAFNRVVDSSDGGDLQSIGFLKLGFIHLETGRFEQAISAFSRSQIVGNNRYLRSVAVTGLASSYIMNGNIGLATKLIDDSLHRFRDPTLRDIGMFLHAFAIMESSDKPSVTNDRQLLECLARMHWPEQFGTQGKYLMAMAYSKLGFKDQSADIAQQGLQFARGVSLRKSLLVQIAESTNDKSRLHELLISSVQQPEFHEAGYLHLKLANMEYDSGNFQACNEHVLNILNDEQMVPFHSKALQLMGRIFDRQGNDYQAALCYAGLLPESSAETDQVGKGVSQ